MSVSDKLKSLGVDVHDHVAVIRIINCLAITDDQKTQMLRKYLNEHNLNLDGDGKEAARFPV